MIYLFSQTLFWLVLAFLLGVFFGWLLKSFCCSPCSSSSSESPQAAEEIETKPAAPEKTLPSDDMRPTALASSEGEADDLKRISGVGPVIEKTLNGLGIFHFSQIAAFTRDNIAWVDNAIDFPGRIEREDWVGQCALLAEGKATDFAERYDRSKNK